MDYDYLKKLSPAEKKWLNDFTEEYVHGDFSKEQRIHPKVTDVKKFKNGKVRKIDKYKNESESRINSRNRCIQTISAASSTMHYIEELGERPINSEDEMLEILDKKLQDLNNPSDDTNTRRKRSK